MAMKFIEHTLDMAQRENGCYMHTLIITDV